MPKEGKARVLTETEFKRLISLPKTVKCPNRNIAMIYFSFGLGLRVKGIASLKIPDVFDERLQVKEEINGAQ